MLLYNSNFKIHSFKLRLQIQENFTISKAYLLELSIFHSPSLVYI